MRWFSFESFGIFIGALLILLGVSFIVKAVWNIDWPIFRIGIALFFIYLGLGMIFQPPWKWNGTRAKFISEGAERTWIFSSAQTTLEEGASNFNAIFGELKADFSGLQSGEKRVIQCNAIFGSMEIILPRDVPVRIEGHAVFGSVSVPDKQSVHFGTLNSDATSEIVIVANAVFGSIEFKVR